MQRRAELNEEAEQRHQEYEEQQRRWLLAEERRQQEARELKQLVDHADALALSRRIHALADAVVALSQPDDDGVRRWAERARTISMSLDPCPSIIERLRADEALAPSVGLDQPGALA
jgi:hypothetical protein